MTAPIVWHDGRTPMPSDQLAYFAAHLNIVPRIGRPVPQLWSRLAEVAR